MQTSEHTSLPVLRGTAHGADCGSCPLAFNGQPHRPVFSEHPEQPKWILLGEGPGFNEVRHGRCFVGASGEVVMQLLARIGCKREDVYIGNVTLCGSNGADENTRQQAAKACKTRLDLELAQFPGVPILTLGAIAARGVIPQQALDAIDPPDVPESKQKRQKKRQKDQFKEQRDHAKKLERAFNKVLKSLLDYHKKQLRVELRAKLGRKTPKEQIEIAIKEELRHVEKQLIRKAKEEAPAELELMEIAKANKPKKVKAKKKKPIKITDIVGSCFDVDVDGTGVRPVIPAIHPAALLRGGGKGITGSHTPDLAYVNLMYDFAKANAIAEGQDVRLAIEIQHEGVDAERATWLFVEAIQQAFETGECAIDLETYVDDPETHHALMAYVARVNAIGLAWRDAQGQIHARSVLWGLIAPWAQSYFQAMLVSERVICTYHNGLYDRTVLMGNGFELRPQLRDTLLAHHSAFPGCGHGLQIVTSQFFATAPWKSEYKNADEDVDKLLTYNAKDVGSTLAIHPSIEIVVKKNRNERTYDIDRKMSECATRMHLAGMPVSREVNTELLNQFSKSVAESREAVETVAADPKLREQIWHHLALEQAKVRRKDDIEDFETRYNVRRTEIEDENRKGNWRWRISASKHVAALIQALGVELTQVTASGGVSTKKDILESLVHIPTVRDLLIFRESDKLLSTFCLAPGTRVLTSDLRWVPIETLRVDDELVGFDEHGRGKASKKGPAAKYQRSKVEAVSKGELVCYRITTDRGVVVVASEDHLWLARDGSKQGRTRYWKKTQNLEPGDVLAGFGDPWPDDRSWEAGFISGFLDGEGWVGRDSACLSQNTGMALDHVMGLMRGKGFDLFINKKGDPQKCVNVFPHGGFVGATRMLGQFRPPRLLEKASRLWEGKPTGSPSNPLSVVLRVEKIGKHPVIAMRTSTKTFIAEGLLTHNCWQMFDRYDGDQRIQAGYADANDRIHPIWNIHKISGRWASYEPVVSNVPKSKWKKQPDGTMKEVRPNLRRQIVAPPGRKFVLFDFAQLEARNLALISGDEFLLDVFATGKDIHTECSRVVFNGQGGTTPFDQLDPITGGPCEKCGKGDFHHEKCKLAKMKKQLRDLVKQVEYGAFYGGSPETLWKVLLKEGFNVKLSDVTDAINKLMAKMPGIVRWQRMTVAKAALPPYTITDFVLGRRRVFPMGQVDPNEALNFESQATAAAIMDTGMYRMHQRIVDQGYKQCDAIVQVHDAAAYECWEGDAEDVAADVVSCYTQSYEREGRTIPYPVDVAITDSWAGL